MSNRNPPHRITISREIRLRLRREFVPRDFAPALQELLQWSTKDSAPGETALRLHRAVLTLARGNLEELRRSITAAKEDYRDVLCWAASRTEEPHRRRQEQEQREEQAGQANPDETAFLAAIAETPADHLLKLVYADWLDDQGDPRAAYMRCLCEWITSRKRIDIPLFEREESLRTRCDPVWLARIRGLPVPLKKRTKRQ